MAADENTPGTTPGGPLRVTHLLHTIAYGGIETVIINWLRYSRPEDLDIQLVVFANPGGTEQAFIREAAKFDLQVHTIPWSRRKPVLRASRELAALMKEHRSEVLHTHNAYAELVGLMSRRHHPVKVLTTVYVWAGRDFGFKRYILQKMSAWVIKRMDLLTVQCEKAREESRDWGFRMDDSRVLPSGYEILPSTELTPAKREALRRERGAQEGDTIVCNVARLYPEKAQARMLRMWKRVLERHPNTKLWIYGVGPLEEELTALWKELELEDSVRFMGFASDLMLELSLCDVQWHPSYNEGIPIAICAGMAAALPIAATAVGGIPEVIKHEETGLLADRDNEEEIEGGLERLIADPSLQRTLGDAAKRFVEDDYSMEFAVGVLADTYRGLVGRG